MRPWWSSRWPAWTTDDQAVRGLVRLAGHVAAGNGLVAAGKERGLAVTPLVVILALGGACWGFAADRIAARWPEHEDEAGLPSIDPPRRLDWRTAVVTLTAGAALGGVALRFDEPLQLGLFAAWAAVLILLLATDLDQRLLPDVLTLPLIPVALLFGVLGLNPLVADGLVAAAAAAVVFPVGLYLLSIPFGAGAIGMGDLKLLVSVGLTVGLLRTFSGIVLGALLSALVVLVLLGFRVIDRRSYIPYGPFLILGTLWATLVQVA